MQMVPLLNVEDAQTCLTSTSEKRQEESESMGNSISCEGSGDTSGGRKRCKPIKIKDKILKQCKVKDDDWAEMVMVRVAGFSNDLHASGASYQNDCLSRFFSQRNAPGDSKGTHDEEQEETLQSTEMRADHTKIWDSVGVQERFKRADLLKMLSLAVDDIFILSAPGYRKVVRFCNNARATLIVKRDDAEEDNIDDALDMIARVIKAEVCETERSV